MSEFNFKNFKPTLSTPTPQGKQLDTNFKKQMRPTGMSIKEEEKNGEDKKTSLKKSIFKLDKMETLVHTDENLAKVFNEMKEDASEKFGYHWNETILNIIFNDYILNSPKYLHKYKIIRAKPKTRRGEEGIVELQNDIDKEKEASKNAEDRKNDLMTGVESGEGKEKVDELFGFKSASAPAPIAPTSKDDTYFVDTRNKKLLGVVPAKASPEERQRIMTPFLGNPNFKQLAWLAAYDMGVKGIPTTVSDGTTIDQIKQEMNAKYKNVGGYQSIPAMVEQQKELNTPKQQSAHSIKADQELQASLDNFNKNLRQPLRKIGEPKPSVGETDSSSSGAFAMGLDVQGKQGNEVTDQTYQNETTTSSSSGQYSGKAIWSKNGTPAANKPAWKGGKIIGESVINGHSDYLTNSEAFKQYITKVEILQLLNEEYEISEAETFQQTAQRLLGKLHQYAIEDPYLKNDADFQDLIKRKEYEAQTGKAFTAAPTQQPVQQQKQVVPLQQPVMKVAESTDQDQFEDVIFLQGDEAEEPLQILHDQGQDAAMEYLKQSHDYGNHMDRNELPHGSSDQTYEKDGYHMSWNDSLGYIGLTYDLNHGIAEMEQQNPMFEANNFIKTMVKDLKYTGRPANDNESANELESQDGLFKGKWNDNKDVTKEPIAESANLAAENLAAWAAQHVLYNDDGDQSAMIEKFAHDNGLSLESLKQKAKFYASNSQLFPNGNTIREVMMELVSAIEQINVNENGLWDNINAKRERGESPLHKGQTGYPDKKQWDNLTKENFGGDPEVGEDQHKEEQSANEYITLEKQMKELAALKAAGNIEALKAKVASLPMIPIASHAGSPDEFGHRDLEDLGYLRCAYQAIDDDDHELMIKNVSNKPVAQLDNYRHTYNVIQPGEMQESVKKQNLITEKAVSKKQQKFMGMVHAAQKGKLKHTSKAVEKAAESMSDKDAEDFASTKHKGIPEKVKKDKKKKVDEGIFGNDRPAELGVEQIAQALDNFKQSPESEQLRNQFVKAKDYVKQKAGNIMRMPQLKMWLDQNMPQLSNNISTLWGNWDLVPTDKLTETKDKMKIDKDQYKELIKAKLKSSGKSLKNMADDEKKGFFNEAHGEYHQIKENMIDDQPDSMINNQESSITKSMDSDELNKDGAAIGGAVEESFDNPDYYSQGKDDPNAAPDADKFRAALKAKYGVDSVSDLSNIERQELIKSMSFGNNKKAAAPDLSGTNYEKSDAQRMEYERNNDPSEMLDYLNKNVGALQTTQDFKKLASNYKATTGKDMQHPMAIFGAIQKMSPEARSNYVGLENYFKSNMDKRMNEERKNSAIINVEKLGDENAKNFKKDMSLEDGISDDTNYPFKKSGIYNEKIWPDPSKFYIEQDKKKVQDDMTSFADLEKKALAKTKGSLENIGDATADGKNIPKRNLTKDEMYSLAMNRGDGMQDIVYDNKPSDKFEKRMEADMGENVYKARQDKMDFKADAPMYNKDTQPQASGDKKDENNKFKVGYNNESVVTAKYSDEYGKIKLVEFKMIDVQELTSIDENAFKLSMDGMGNKYAFVGKKINENTGYENITEKYDFYLHEGSVFAVEKKKAVVTEKKQIVNESKFNKMKHLMNYKPSNYVDPNKSVKF